MLVLYFCVVLSENRVVYDCGRFRRGENVLGDLPGAFKTHLSDQSLSLCVNVYISSFICP